MSASTRRRQRVDHSNLVKPPNSNGVTGTSSIDGQPISLGSSQRSYQFSHTQPLHDSCPKSSQYQSHTQTQEFGSLYDGDSHMGPPPPIPPPSRSFRFGESGCTCAKCMRNNAPSCLEGRSRVDAIANIVHEYLATVGSPSEIGDIEQFCADICHAAEQASVPLLEKMIQQFRCQNFQSLLASEFMVAAAQQGKVPMLDMLVKYDGNIDHCDETNRGTPLMYASAYGNGNIIKQLIEYGAHKEEKDITGYTALMIAVFSDRASAAEALLQCGTNVETQDPRGRTALSFAAIHGATDCLSVLSQAGADVYHKDHDGKTPLDLAIEQNRSHIIEIVRRIQIRSRLRSRKQQRQQCKSQIIECAPMDEEEYRKRQAAAERAAKQLIEQEESEARQQQSCRNSKRKVKSKDANKRDGVGKQQACEDSGIKPPHRGNVGNCSAVIDGGRGIIGRKKQDGRGCSGEGQFSKAGQQTVGNGHSNCNTDSVGSQADDSAQQAWGDGQASLKSQISLNCDSEYDSTQIDSQNGNDLVQLRADWEQLQRKASNCDDADLQPELKEQLKSMMRVCSERGISVRWARKILSRLERVGQARAQLVACLDDKHVTASELQMALENAKNVRNLIKADIIQSAESLHQYKKRLEDAARYSAITAHLAACTVGDLTEETECVVCMERRRDCVCLPCEHVSMCFICASNVYEKQAVCPICRTKIEHIQQLVI